LYRECPATKYTSPFRLDCSIMLVIHVFGHHILFKKEKLFVFKILFFVFSSPDRTRTRNNDRGQNAGQLSGAVGSDAGRVFHTRNRAGQHSVESCGSATVAGRFGRRRRRESQEQGNRCDPSRRARCDRRVETG